MLRSLVGSEMCIRDRYRTGRCSRLAARHSLLKMLLFARSLINHRSMLILFMIMLLASAVIVRLLWQTERLHHERLSNAYQQYTTAKILLESRAPEDAAALWKLHWIATQTRFENYLDKEHWPRLSLLYHERPYQLHNRIEKIGGRANDGLETPVPSAANSTLLSGCLLYTSPSPRDS